MESVERFLADAGDEGLTWEGKSNAAPRRDSVVKAVCGFANAVGGYLIIGAERQESGWRLPGVELPTGEPATRISSFIASGGVSPLPFFDAKSFDRGGGRGVVVVLVEPVLNPPCITASGVVYQRVSGQTLPVTDQRVLSELIQKGHAARQQTEARALRAAQRAMVESIAFGPDHSVLAVALCSAGGPEDRSSVLFDEERAALFNRIAGQYFQPEDDAGYVAQNQIQQDSVRVWTASDETGNGTNAAAYWDDSASVSLSVTRANHTVPDLTRCVIRFWRGLSEVIQLFGGVGDTHLAVVLNQHHNAVHQAGSKGFPREPVRRWTEARWPTEDEMASVVRELERGFGRASWEKRAPPRPS